MTDNPYINKQNWGRDLLDRLNNFSDDDGSFNIWEELPITGKDGQILGISHAGYTGILKAKQSSIKTWNGSQWEEIIRVPIEYQGEEVPTTVSTESANSIVLLNPSHLDSFFYSVFSDGTGSFYVKKIRKSTLASEWTSTIAMSPGFTRIFVYNIQDAYETFCTDDSRIFIGTVSGPSLEDTSSYLIHIYCLSLDSGTLQWSTALSGDRIVSMRAGNGFLYALQYDRLLHRINPATGSVINTLNLNTTITNISFYGDIWIAANTDIILKTHHTTRPTIAKIASDLSTIKFAQKLEGGAFTSVQYQYFIQDAANLNLIYFCDFIDDQPDKLWCYDSSNNQMSVVATIPEVQGLFVGTEVRNGEIYFYHNRGTSLVSTKLDNNSLDVTQTYVSGGVGSVLHSRIKSFQLNIVDLLKTYILEYGFGNQKTTEYKISSSKSFQQIVSFGASTFSTAERTNQILSPTSLSETYTPRLTTGWIDATNLYVGNSQPAPDFQIKDAANRDNGIRIGQYGTMFSYYRTVGGMSTDTIGYTGSARGYHVFGLGFNAKPIAGRLVTMLSSPSVRFSAVQLFDVTLGKMFFDVKDSGTVPESLIAQFPSSTPTMVLTPGLVGIKNQSPSFELDVTGTIRATEIRNSAGVVTSDPRLKTNMTSLDGSDLWDVCERLNPISFLYHPDFELEVQSIEKDDEGNDIITTSKQKWPLPQGIQYGYNAVEIADFFPELVDEDPQGIKYLNSGALFPIFQAAATSKIQSLESEIESLKQLVQSLVIKIEALENV